MPTLQCPWSFHHGVVVDGEGRPIILVGNPDLSPDENAAVGNLAGASVDLLVSLHNLVSALDACAEIDNSATPYIRSKLRAARALLARLEAGHA